LRIGNVKYAVELFSEKTSKLCSDCGYCSCSRFMAIDAIFLLNYGKTLDDMKGLLEFGNNQTIEYREDSMWLVEIIVN
jgi:hypothetical protein